MTSAIEPDFNENSLEYLDDDTTQDDLPDEQREPLAIPRGDPYDFEVELTDGVSLSSKTLAGLISDLLTMIARSTRPAELLPAEIQPARKRQRVDVSTLSY